MDDTSTSSCLGNSKYWCFNTPLQVLSSMVFRLHVSHKDIDDFNFSLSYQSQIEKVLWTCTVDSTAWDNKSMVYHGEMQGCSQNKFYIYSKLSNDNECSTCFIKTLCHF